MSGPSGGEPRSTSPRVDISWGELVDKITILEIKERRLSAPAAVANVQRELAGLNAQLTPAAPDVAALKQALKAINETLWDVEDEIRGKEARQSFDAEFVALARSVYLNNDKRAALKREINTLLKSDLVEEKQYTPYGR